MTAGAHFRNVRLHGGAPFRAAVIHGGPGAAGEMAPVARHLATYSGILEPLQTAKTLSGQVEELRTVLYTHGDLPITLIGHSWGAWLSYLVSAQAPAVVGKLILVGSGPFEARCALSIQETRLSRLSPAEREEFKTLMASLEDPAAGAGEAALARLGALAAQADAYDPLPAKDEPVEVQVGIFRGVWREAAALRRSGELLAMASRIRCPVLALHGDFDPHPAEGVREPLTGTLSDFRFILLRQCGHKPWIERQARDEFYRLLEAEIREGPPLSPARTPEQPA